MINYPLISFITPTFNSAKWLPSYLASINKQDYPKEKIEIIFVDGGSSDNTIDIAASKGIKVVLNELILGDPGFAVGAQHASGDYMVFMGHDNELVQINWIKRMLVPFAENPHLFASFPHLENRDSDTWLTRYVNKFTDPGNHFVYGYANNPLTFNKIYPTKSQGDTWTVFDFSVENHPILEFEQGFMIKKVGYSRSEETWYCGILAVINLIKERKEIAYVSNASNFHTTLNKGLSQFIKKHRWAINYNLDSRETFGIYKKSFGLKARKKYISAHRKIRIYLYPFYGISLVIPCIRAIIMFLKDGDREGIYHPLITFVSASLIWYEFIRIKVLKGIPIIDRY